MRFLPSIALLITATSMAGAQISLDEQPIQDSMTRLRAQASMVLQLDGTDNFSGRVTSFSSTSFYAWSPLGVNAPLFADIFEFTNGFPSRRIVANGVTVFAYTNATNTYSSSAYGTETNPQPVDARNVMFQALGTESRSSTTFVVRFLKEIFGGDSALYHTWLPGAQVQTIGNGQYVKDPVSQHEYMGGPNDFYILYTYGSRLTRSAAFHLVRPDEKKPFDISEIYYTDVQAVKSSNRTLDWKMVINPLTTATTNYEFIPPKTARAIASRRPGG